MKNAVSLITLILFITSACKDSNSTSQPQVAQAKQEAQSGSWIISYYFDSNTDETANFTGYEFTFESDGTVSAVHTTTTVRGTWTITTEDKSADDSSGNAELDFNISFSSPSDFESLTEDWHVISTSDTKLELTHVSGGHGGTDFLTFKKSS